jgi:hypothetical protein
VLPDLPLDEYQFCLFQRWRTSEIAYYVLSILYGTSFPSLGIHTAITNPFFIEDSSAFLIIIYSAKHRGVIRVRGIPSLLDNIVQGATVYFLVILLATFL